MRSNARIHHRSLRLSGVSGTTRLLLLLLAVFLLWAGTATVYSSVIHRKYTNTRQVLGDDIYDAVSRMILTYNGITVQGADVENTILPEMSRLFATAKSLNSCLGECYGKGNMVLSDETVSSFSSAFESYSLAYRTGGSTKDADLLMKGALESARNALSERYDDLRRLK